MTLSPASGSAVAPSCSRSGGEGSLVLSGVWTIHTLHTAENSFRKAAALCGANARFDLSGISALDTAGALLINLGAQTARKASGGSIPFSGASDTHADLLKKSVPPKEESPPPAPSSLRTLVEDAGRTVCEGAQTSADLVAFMGHFLTIFAAAALRPAKFRFTSLIFHMEQTGLRAVPIVMLLNFLIGMVVAYMGVEALTRFGGQMFTVNLLEVIVTREMAVLITAIVVAGRSSSAFTAQIGAMVANEEVAAMRSMGLDPMNLLVVPRVTALVITLPFLVFAADIAALAGGAAACAFSMDLSLPAFIGKFHEAASLRNFLTGMVKTPFFAGIIGLVGCFQGFRASSSAESVGFLTTIAVVQAIFLVILADAFFAVFFTTIGI